MLLSIVIPIFKVEKYIDACLKSIFQQNVNEDLFSVVLVDDGSPDNSVALCRPYLELHNNVKLIRQKNCGLSVARNIGLEHSSGDYVWFVDSDDMIEENAISSILCNLEKHNADCFLIGHDEVDEEGNIIKQYRYEDNAVINGLAFLSEKIKDCEFFIPVQFTIWRVKFLKENSFSFFPYICHEDCEFTPKVISKAALIISIPGIHYKYIRHEHTISTTINSKRAYDYLSVANSLCLFAQLNSNADILYNYSSMFVNSAIKIIVKCSFADIRAFYVFISTKKICMLKNIATKSRGKYKITAWGFFILSKIKIWN